MNGIKRISALFKRNVKEILRDPLSLAFTFVLPEAMLVIFYFAFHTKTSQFEMKYLCPSIIVFAQAFLSLFIGLLISADRDGAYITRLYVSGARAGEFIAGYALSAFPIALFQSILIFATGTIIEPDFFSAYMLIGLLFSVLTAMLFINFGLLFGSLFGVKSVGGAASVVITGQSVLSGMWFPLESLSEGFIGFLKVLPFKNATDLLVGAANGFEFSDGVAAPLIIVAAYSALIFALAVFAFKRQMRK